MARPVRAARERADERAKGPPVRRLGTTLLLSLSMLWFALLPALATEGEEAGEGSQIEGGGDDAFLYLFVFGIVVGIAVFLDARSNAPADEDSQHEGATH